MPTGAIKVTNPVAPFGQHVTWDWEKENLATSKKRNEAGMLLKTKDRPRRPRDEAGMLLMAKEIVSRSRNIVENEGTYRKSCGNVSWRRPPIAGASTDDEKGSGISAPNVSHSILQALGLAEIGHPPLNSAKPSSFFEWQLFFPAPLTVCVSIRCLTPS